MLVAYSDGITEAEHGTTRQPFDEAGLDAVLAAWATAIDPRNQPRHHRRRHRARRRSALCRRPHRAGPETTLTAAGNGHCHAASGSAVWDGLGTNSSVLNWPDRQARHWRHRARRPCDNTVCRRVRGVSMNQTVLSAAACWRVALVCAVAARWRLAGRGAAQPRAAPAPSAVDRGLAALYERVEQALVAGDAAALRAARSPPIPSPLGTAAFAPASVPRSGATRAVVRERDREPLGRRARRHRLPRAARHLRRVRQSRQRAHVAARRAEGAGGARLEWSVGTPERLTSVDGLYRLALDRQKQFRITNLRVTAEDLDDHHPERRRLRRGDARRADRVRAARPRRRGVLADADIRARPGAVFWPATDGCARASTASSSGSTPGICATGSLTGALTEMPVDAARSAARRGDLQPRRSASRSGSS